jgi:hypothetical protein
MATAKSQQHCTNIEGHQSTGLRCTHCKAARAMPQPVHSSREQIATISHLHAPHELTQACIGVDDVDLHSRCGCLKWGTSVELGCEVTLRLELVCRR